MRHDADISSLTQVMSNARQMKDAPQQPAGLRTRYLPIGVGRASPTLEDSPAAASDKPKKEKKKGKAESEWEKPEKIKSTPVAPPTVPGMR